MFRLLCAVVLFVFTKYGYAFSTHQLVKNVLKSSSTSLLASSTEVSFGDRIPMKISLPTRDLNQARSFISNLDSIVEQTYETGKYTKISSGKYILKFNTLPLPGIDKVTPEIEVQFFFDEITGTINMKSGNWTLKGSTNGVLKDSRFMQSFAIELEGVLTILPQTNLDSSIIADGFVKYVVQGEKPSIFQAAPDFVLEKTIEFIKDNVSQFASKDFQNKFLKAFRSFALSDLKAKKILNSPINVKVN